METYTPRPIETSGIVLDAELLGLLEQLAASIHDTWAVRRIQEGWSFGPARNDQEKLHPCLVPYSELPDSEKEYDRTTVAETLRTLVALGYRILPPSGSKP